MGEYGKFCLTFCVTIDAKISLPSLARWRNTGSALLPNSSKENVLRWAYLGRMPYRQGLALQDRLREKILAGKAGDALLLLEHSPVITRGRRARQENVLCPASELKRRDIEVVDVSRGGDVTYHGPGQLVGYPVRYIGRQVRGHVEATIDGIRAVLSEYGIQSRWRPELPGIWTEKGKICALGIDARRRVSTHGFALNVTTDLAAFELIVPCGLDQPVTSMQQWLNGRTPGLAQLAAQVAQALALRYGATLAPVNSTVFAENP